jgi:4-carboxymuconolactone decarboxylase
MEMPRLAVATRDKIAEDQVGLFDEIVKELGAAPNIGPRSILAYVPKAYRLEEELRDYLANDSLLSSDVTELVILVTARELDCQYVWNSHAASARKAGIADDLVDALRDRKALPQVSDKYHAVISYGREFFRTHHVSAGTFGAVKEHFGERGLVELSVLFGDYCMLITLLNANDPQLRARTEPILPIC